jgi:antitoxin VapB
VALNIRNKEAEALAAEVARRTGETKTEAVINALKERLARVKRLRPRRRLSEDLAEIAERFDTLSVLDSRDTDEILGYDQHGLSR